MSGTKLRNLISGWRVVSALPAGLALAGCSGSQSALAPAAPEAARLAMLFWWMLGGSLVVCALMIVLTVVAARSRQNARWARTYIIGGGVVFPTVVLAGLLVFGLSQLPDMLAPAPEGSLRIRVSGEQWWWRVHYQPADGAPVELANEIRLPVGEPVEFELVSPDVIHSFWIPSLGGKMDMIPGRRNRLRLNPTETGTFRGVCAEYCGDSHALMAFPVVVMEREAFDTWLEQQRQPARGISEEVGPSVAAGADRGDQPPEPTPAGTTTPELTALLAHGKASFLFSGCGACHTIRGTEAAGLIGPDLTHVGSRLSLGAGILPNDHAAFVRWLAETDRVKPGVLMPHFGMLPPEELNALAAYLDSLE